MGAIGLCWAVVLLVFNGWMSSANFPILIFANILEAHSSTAVTIGEVILIGLIKLLDSSLKPNIGFSFWLCINWKTSWRFYILFSWAEGDLWSFFSTEPSIYWTTIESSSSFSSSRITPSISSNSRWSSLSAKSVADNSYADCLWLLSRLVCISS